MRKIFLYLIILLIFVSSVLANPQYINYGFAATASSFQYGIFYPPNGLWASNSRDYGYPTQSRNQSFGNYRLPIVANLDKSSSLSKPNEIYLFSTGEITIYDNSFSQIGNYILTGWNGTISIVDIPNTNNLYIAYLSLTGTDWNLNILNRSGFGFQNIKTINVTDYNYTGSIKGDAENIAYAYIWDYNFNVTRINLINSTETHYNAWSPNLTQCAITFSPFYNNDVQIDDLNLDGNADFLAISGDAASGSNIYISILDTSTGTWSLKKKQTGVSTTEGCSIASAHIGYSSSSPKIIAFTRGASANTRVYDLSGNQLFADTNAYTKAYPIVGDINRDGQNELIDFPSTGTIKIYDSTFTNIYSSNTVVLQGSTRDLAGNQMSIINLGGYNSSTIWQEFITPIGILTLNTSNFSSSIGFTRTYNFSLSAVNTFVSLPVAIQSQSKDDILSLSEGTSNSAAFFTQSIPVFCGDGFCSPSETFLTCPIDCKPIEPSSAVLTSVTINPCNTQLWFLNTTVQVTAKAETNDKSHVNINVIFAGSAPSASGCSQNASASNIQSGANVTFNFLANCTGSDNILVTATSVSNSDTSSLSFPFTVSQFSGISFGDSTCGIQQELTPFVPNANTTLNPNDNSIRNSLIQINNIYHIGIVAIWLILMGNVGIIILVLCGNARLNPSITTGIIIFMEGILFFLGGILKILNTGVIVGIIVLAIIAIVIGISRKVSPT